MLKSEITLTDLRLQVSWNNERVIFGGSWIEPFHHSALETALVRTEGQWFFVIRERMTNSANFQNLRKDQYVEFGTYAALFQECLAWPLDYLIVEVVQESCRMRVRAGVLGTAPIYCHTRLESVTLSWDFADCLKDKFSIDTEVAAHRLALATFYSARTICVGIQVLTERASLYIEPGLVRYSYPDAVEQMRDSPKAALDEQAAFANALYDVVTARPVAPSQIAMELSGGMDSATVAVALRKAFGAFGSRGILLDGDGRDSQFERRHEVVSRLGLNDRTMEMADYLPSLDLGIDARRKEHPLGEFYLEAFEAIWSDSRMSGADYLCTGIGGDELFPLFADEKDPHSINRQQKIENIRRSSERILSTQALTAVRSMRAFDAPTSPVAMTSLIAHLCRAPYMLRNKLWPINPLSDPNLTEYCHSLPYSARISRETMRRYLNQELGADVFPRNYIKETFARVFPEKVAREKENIRNQLKECALADLRLVNHAEVLKLLDEVSTSRSEDECGPLVFFLWTERFVRQVT